MTTFIVSAVIGLLIASIVINEIRKKKSGKGTCSCGCSACAMKDCCKK